MICGSTASGHSTSGLCPALGTSMNRLRAMRFDKLRP
jgi:hypothetical protein